MSMADSPNTSSAITDSRASKSPSYGIFPTAAAARRTMCIIRDIMFIDVAPIRHS